MRLRIGALIAVVAIGTAAVAFWLVSSGEPTTVEYLTATVQRSDVVRDVVADGTVQATATYGLSFGLDPQLIVDVATAATSAGLAGSTGPWSVSEVRATVGQRVRKGAILAVADVGHASQQLAVAEAALAAAQARLAVDEAGPSAAARRSAFDAVRQAEAQVTQAQRSLASTTSQNAIAARQAQAALTRAQQKFDDDVAAGAPQELLDADTNAIIAAQDNLDAANARATASASGADAQVTAASSQLSAAQQALADTQYQNGVAVQQAQTAHNDAVAALGALLAQPDPDPAAVTQARALVDQTYDVLQSTQARAQATNNAAAAQVTAAQTQLSQAQQAQTNTASQGSLTVQQAQAALARARQKYDDDVAKGAPKAVLEADRNQVTAAQDALDTTRARASASLDAAQAQLASAGVALQAARNSYAVRVGPADQAIIAADRAQVASAEQNVRTARNALARAALVSPVDGTVVAVNLEPGVNAPPGYAIEIQSESLKVAADFAESDVPALAIGQPATVTITALRDVADGRVAEIKPVATTGVGKSVVTYRVIVALPAPPAGARAGMSASVAVATARAADVLAVPVTAISGSEGDYSVRVIDANGEPQTRAVKIGLVSSALVEITGGLSEGEAVVVGTAADRVKLPTDFGAGQDGGPSGPSPSPGNIAPGGSLGTTP